jgi:hypothetical protein
MKVKSKYWYFITYYECPICGRGGDVKERRYGYRPKLWKNRHAYIVLYDYCDVL